MSYSTSFPSLPCLLGALLFVLGPIRAQEPPPQDSSATAPPATSGALPKPEDAKALTPAAETPFDPASLEGEHRCRGRNPDGTAYQGMVSFHLKDGLVLMEWNINGRKSYGAGLWQGTALGVGLDDGVAIYQLVPQPQGASLIGLWATEGAKAACEEVIFFGDSDAMEAKFPLESINGAYLAITAKPDGTRDETPFTISGRDSLKQIKLKDGPLAEGLLLGDGLAVITPTGLSMFHIGKDPAGKREIRGRSLDQTTISEASLVPSE